MAEQDRLRPVTASQMARLEDATSRYQGGLHAAAADWLAARGIAEETAATFRLGVVTDPSPGHESVEGWLAIPYLGYNDDGQEIVLSQRFRCLPELVHPGLTCKDLKHGKYKGMPHEAVRTFNTRAVWEAEYEIHVCEGELDAVILNQAGMPAIGLPGSTQWRQRHVRMLAGFARVFVWGDPDEAGSKFTSQVLASLPKSAGPVKLTAGDVTDTFLAGDYEALDAAREAVKWG